MIFPLKQDHITIAKAVSPPTSDSFHTNSGNPQQIPVGTLKVGNLEGLPPPRPPTPGVTAPLLFSPRCKIKGCVFPASDLATGMCHSHDLEETEPEFFQTFQPILYVLQQAKYGIPDQSFEDQRGERRLRVAHHKASMKGAA